MLDQGSFFEALLDQGPCCVLIVDEARTFCRVYGDSTGLLRVPAPSLVGRPVLDVLEPRATSQWRERLDRAFRGESFLVRTTVGDSVWFLDVVPVRLDGQIHHISLTARDITPWVAAEQELRNAVLTAVTALEYERRTAAKFLHDKVGQNLTALGLQLDLARMDVETVSPETAARIVEVQELLERMMEEVREYSNVLNPTAVERAGLRSALDRLALRVQSRFSGQVRVNVDPSLKIDPRAAFAMFQIAQEAVENAVRHASCSVIEIALKSTKAGISLEVRDNGRGFDPGSILGGRRGLGLLTMEHYAAQAGLDLKITSSKGKSTRIRAAAPKAE
jgi:signal transduction histidine kinase